VVLEDLESGEQVRYKIVGTDEADAKAGLISLSAPLGKALLGKRKEDEVTVETPRGQRSFSISDVLYR
jgi:transcription elongation GreA/GreB family factor